MHCLDVFVSSETKLVNAAENVEAENPSYNTKNTLTASHAWSSSNNIEEEQSMHRGKSYRGGGEPGLLFFSVSHSPIVGFPDSRDNVDGKMENAAHLEIMAKEIQKKANGKNLKTYSRKHNLWA